MRPYPSIFSIQRTWKIEYTGESTFFRGSVGLALNRKEINLEFFPRLSFLGRIPVKKWIMILENHKNHQKKIRGRRVHELEMYFDSKVKIPLIRHEKRQKLEALINEEALLFAKYLKGEKKSWAPRVATLYCSRTRVWFIYHDFPYHASGWWMDKRTYRFAVGIVLVILSLAFFILPSLLNLDYFIPFMFALVSFILGVGSFYMGYSEK